ncbi:MAG: xylulokinase [Anaerolineales bacterium]|nr:xylulokinase [Anaerolineales bacterium]
MSYFIGIDSSTTATKTLLMDAAGKIISVASSEYTFETPHPLWSEQDPALWWQATIHSIRAVLADSGLSAVQIKGIGLTGQMHGLVLLDADGQVLRPAILWNDQRTIHQCETIRDRLGRQNLIEITGNDALTGFTAPKILWVKDEEPEIYARVCHILLPKDYVRYKLTGEYAMDRAGGSGTILFDLHARTWSPQVLAALEIDPAWLPPTFEGTQVTGTLTREAARTTGLEAGTPVMGGGGDQAAAAVGTGAVEEGLVSLSLGTSGVVFATMDRPAIEPQGRLHAFCHAVPHKWHLMGVMLSAAGSLRWHRDTFAPNLDFNPLVAPADGIPAGSDGLLFMPYLTGERTPYPDPLARGGFIGLTIRHTLPHLTRAVLEGVSFGLRDSFELIRAAGLSGITQVRVTGGGARSPLWLQILADVLNVELVTLSSEEGAAFGAALLAATGAGVFQDVPSACKAVIQITGRTAPGADVQPYADFYPLYQQLYPALSPTFNALAHIRG